MTDERHMTRRRWLASVAGSVAGGVALSGILPAFAHAGGSVLPAVTVYKDPSCGCCTKWVAHLTASGLKPVVKDRADMPALKDSLGVPAALRSCHTAVAGKYVIEGHVPASDLKRLLSTAPKGVLGLAVPDMPALKDSLGVPAALRSCHTAVAGKYVIEGHVPAADLKRLLSTAPKGVLGLAVPDMPAGSPGMEMAGRSDRFDVIAFSAGGRTQVFATHG